MKQHFNVTQQGRVLYLFTSTVSTVTHA
jgi:hypothetical protein